MSSVGFIRPSEWELPVFLHVLGSMLLVGSTALVLACFAFAWRRDAPAAASLRRLGFRSLLVAVIPSYLLMRVSAEWARTTEDVSADATWIGIGYAVSEGGLVLLVISTILAASATRRDRTREGGGAALARVVAVLTAVVAAAYLVAVWAMTAKP